MTITVQLFASLAEAAGTRSVEVEASQTSETTAGTLTEAVFARFPALAELRASVIVAVNAEYVEPDFPVSPGDDVALIPPVSGGGEIEDDAYFRITEELLDVGALHDLVLRPKAGAVSMFSGVVRDNNLGREVDYLEYEAYPAMATKVMRQIAEEMRCRWEVCAVAIHHRRGRLEIGEASVLIAVSSPHRQEGIEACHYAIDRLKQIVPIWKKEVWADGEHWVEGSLTPREEARGAAESETD
jgi:molybdopterin converting factor subunit 1